MKKLFLIILICLTATLTAQQVEIFPQIVEDAGIDCISYSPNGMFVLTVYRNNISGVGSVKIWDAENGRELKTLYTGFRNATSRGYCSYAEYSPDGKTVLMVINGGNDTNGIIRIVDVETGRTVRRISGHTGIVYEAFFSPDGRRIVSCGDDRTIKIWNVDTGQEIRTINERAYSITWGPEGRQIASVDNNTVIIWNAETGRQIRSINLTENSMFRLKWSNDGRRLMIGNSYNRIVLDANTGNQILKVQGVQFSVG